MKKDCSVASLKYLPVVAAAMAFLHVIGLLLGIHLPVFEIAEVVIGFAIIISFSVRLGFCLRHRLLIYYAGAVTACIYLQRFIGLGTLKYIFRYVLLTAGILLLVYFIVVEVWRKIRKNS